MFPAYFTSKLPFLFSISTHPPMELQTSRFKGIDPPLQRGGPLTGLNQLAHNISLAKVIGYRVGMGSKLTQSVKLRDFFFLLF